MVFGGTVLVVVSENCGLVMGIRDEGEEKVGRRMNRRSIYLPHLFFPHMHKSERPSYRELV